MAVSISLYVGPMEFVDCQTQQHKMSSIKWIRFCSGLNHWGDSTGLANRYKMRRIPVLCITVGIYLTMVIELGRFYSPSWSLQIYISFSADWILVCEHLLRYGSVLPPLSGENVVSSRNSVCSMTCIWYSVLSSSTCWDDPQYRKWSLLITWPLKSAALSRDWWSMEKSSSAHLMNRLQRQLLPTPTGPARQWEPSSQVTIALVNLNLFSGCWNNRFCGNYNSKRGNLFSLVTSLPMVGSTHWFQGGWPSYLWLTLCQIILLQRLCTSACLGPAF